MGGIDSRIRIQSTKSWQITMQKINLIAQGVLELSHRENADDDDNDNDNDDTHPGWIIVRDGMYSVADNDGNYLWPWAEVERRATLIFNG